MRKQLIELIVLVNEARNRKTIQHKITSKRRVTCYLLNSNRPTSIITLFICSVYDKQKGIIRFVWINVQVHVLATHITTNSSIWQARRVKVYSSRYNERVCFCTTCTIKWRCKRKFIKIQFKLTNWPFVSEKTALECKDTDRRIKSFFVH